MDETLYGLKRAGHEWFKTLYKILSTLNSHQCIGNEGTYTNSDGTVIIGTHVDDLLGFAPTEEDLNHIEKAIDKEVELDQRGSPSKMLAMELQWQQKEIILTQTALIEYMAK